MLGADPQLFYTNLVLSSLFGLTLFGEGLDKIIHKRRDAALPIVFGFMFFGALVFVYVFFSNHLVRKSA